MRQFIQLSYLDAHGVLRTEQLDRLQVADMMAYYHGTARPHRKLNERQVGPNFSRGEKRQADSIRRTARLWWKDVNRG